MLVLVCTAFVHEHKLYSDPCSPTCCLCCARLLCKAKEHKGSADLQAHDAPAKQNKKKILEMQGKKERKRPKSDTNKGLTTCRAWCRI